MTSFQRIVLIAAAVTAAMVWVQPAAAQGECHGSVGQTDAREARPQQGRRSARLQGRGLQGRAGHAGLRDGRQGRQSLGHDFGRAARQSGGGCVRAAAREDLRQGWKAAARGRQGTFQDGDERDRLLRRERQDLHSGIRREDLGNGRRECRAEADHQGPVQRRPSQRRHHLQGRVHLFCARLSEQHRLCRSRQSWLDRHPERSVLGEASGRPRHHAARPGLPRHRPYRTEREVVGWPHDRRVAAGRRARQARHGHQGARALRRLGHAGQDDRPGRATASIRTRRWKSTRWASAIRRGSPSVRPAPNGRTRWR